MKNLVFGIIAILIILIILLMLISTTSKQGTEVIQDDTSGPKTFEELDDPSNPVATITLKQGEKIGTMTFELYPELAPQSVYNFISLANQNYYDGLVMHRLIPDFVIQGGDPEGTGVGGPGYSIRGEFPSNGVETGLTHEKGALAWARSASVDSAGSQFYIVLGDSVDYLDENYAVFGYMIDGEEVLDYLNTVETDSDDRPVEEIVIESVQVNTQGETYPEPDKL